MLTEIEQRIHFLQDIQIFIELDENALADIADRLKYVTYAAGETIFYEGDEPHNLYFILRGKVRVTRFDEDSDHDVELTIFEEGDAFGEDALYFNRMRSATITALTEIELFYLDFDDFTWLRETYPQVEPYLATFARTHEIASRLKISWLGEGEFINLITRRHPISFLGEILVLLVFVSLDLTIITAVSLFLQDLGWLVTFVWIVGGGLALLAILAIIWAWAEWRNDYFIVTNVRVVWRERILFRGSSRQETPLRTIQSMNIQTGNFFHRAIHVGDLIVRTFNSELHMTDVYYPERMKELIQGFILRSRRRSSREQLAEIRRTIRQRLNIEGEEILLEEPENVPPVIAKRYSRFAIFKTRIIENGTITYRKHWSIFIRNALLPNILFALSLIAIFVVAPIMLATDVSWAIYILPVAVFLAVICFLWWLYEYIDWGNDLYRVTHDLIVDRDKKPFGQESFRSAPIKNIQSLGHEVPNLIGLILNVGNVYINVGDETFTFDGVHDPAVVHQDISRKMEDLVAQQEHEKMKQEHERMATWLEIYHEETEDQRFPWRNQGL
jgi:CRP-like cAMP-binding protein